MLSPQFFLLSVLLGQMHVHWDAVNLAVVIVQLVKFDRLGAILVDELEDCLDVFHRERWVQIFYYLCELVD